VTIIVSKTGDRLTLVVDSVLKDMNPEQCRKAIMNDKPILQHPLDGDDINPERQFINDFE